MSDSLIDRLRNNNKATNKLIQNNSIKLNIEEYFSKLLLDLKENDYTENDIKFILDNINTTVEYSKKIIKNN